MSTVPGTLRWGLCAGEVREAGSGSRWEKEESVGGAPGRTEVGVLQGGRRERSAPSATPKGVCEAVGWAVFEAAFSGPSLNPLLLWLVPAGGIHPRTRLWGLLEELWGQ